MMIDIPTAMFVVALAALLTSLLGAVIRGVWRLSTKLGGVEKSLSDEIMRYRQETEEQQEIYRREFGETVYAVRQKITDVEMWARDTFVRRDSFDKVRDDLLQTVNSFGDKIEARLERMETKIDSKT